MVYAQARSKYQKFVISEKEKVRRDIEKKKALISRLQKEKSNPDALKELQSLYPGLVPTK